MFSFESIGQRHENNKR